MVLVPPGPVTPGNLQQTCPALRQLKGEEVSVGIQPKPTVRHDPPARAHSDCCVPVTPQHTWPAPQLPLIDVPGA